jgi:hypoxanthine-DNA glycosylase
MLQIHPFPPVWDEKSRVLILGSLPSVRSRKEGFYYGHPQNRFWRVLAAVFGAPIPATVEEKRTLLLSHGLALWDVIASCRIEGSADASIREAEANDVAGLLRRCPIERLYANGQTAGKLYHKLLEPVTGRPIAVLPSTSPANAAWGMDRLVEAWAAITR